MDGNYHGDTVGAMFIGKSCGFYTPFEKLLFEVKNILFPETWLGDQNIKKRGTIAGICKKIIR